MATYSNVPAVNAAISAQTGVSATLFTVAANSYAVVNLFVNQVSGTTQVSVGGRNVFQTATAGFHDRQYIVAGPGQAIATNIGTSASVLISGVQFTNSM